MSPTAQELKKSNLKSQNGEIDYKKVNIGKPNLFLKMKKTFFSALGGVSVREFKIENRNERNQIRFRHNKASAGGCNSGSFFLSRFINFPLQVF